VRAPPGQQGCQTLRRLSTWPQISDCTRVTEILASYFAAKYTEQQKIHRRIPPMAGNYRIRVDDIGAFHFDLRSLKGNNEHRLAVRIGGMTVFEGADIDDDALYKAPECENPYDKWAIERGYSFVNDRVRLEFQARVASAVDAYFERINLLDSVHFLRGRGDDIAFVLSCPGRRERDNRRPCAGHTGQNRNDLAERIQAHYKIAGFNEPLVTITNAWHKVMFRELGPSEADLALVQHPRTAKRLKIQLQHVRKVIVCCGVPAKAAVSVLEPGLKKANPALKIVFVPHLGNVGLNNKITKDIQNQPFPSYKKASDKPASEKRSLREVRQANRLGRIAVVADRLVRQLGQP